MIVNWAVYRSGRVQPRPDSHADAMAACGREPGDFVWLGLFEPSPDELDEIAAEFGLHPLAVEDAVHAHQRPKLDVYDDSIFVVLRTATYVDPEEVVELGELMAFVGRHFVVTVRHGSHSGLAQIRRRLEDDPDRLAEGPGSVLHAIADLVVDEYEQVLAGLDRDVDEIELAVFSGERIDHTERIFKLKREVVDFRRGVRPLGDPLSDLAGGRVPLVPAELGPWFGDVHDHLLRVSERLDGIDDILSSALTANAAQVGVRQNEDMRKISAWVAIAAVPTVVAGIYGMNFEHMPALHWRYGWLVVFVFLAVACSLLYRELRRRGWL